MTASRPAGPARTSIFISFRSNDTGAYAANQIDRALLSLVGSEHVFRSSRSIPIGSEFPEVLLDGLRRACVTLVLVGPGWLTATGRDAASGQLLRRPDDWVRREVAMSLAAGIPVVPVLLTNAEPLRQADLPDDIQRLADCQYLHLRNRHEEADLWELVRQLRRVAPALFANRLVVDPFRAELPGGGAEPGAPTPPSALLRAEAQVVPFRSRDAELATLHEWLDAPTSTSTMLLTGPGGEGKSRLALELCQQRRESGWLAGTLASPVAARHANYPSVDDLARASELGLPLLVVVDYAEGETARIAELAGALLYRRRPAAPARLLLLARSAGNWRRDLTDCPDDERLGEFFAEMTTFRLAAPAGDFDPVAEFQRAWHAFADRLGAAGGVTPPAPLPPAPPPAPALGAAAAPTPAGSLLVIHSAALNAVLDHQLSLDDDARPAQPSAADPVARLLRHERRYWRRTVKQASLPEPFVERLDAVVTASTLFGASTRAELRAVLTRLPPLDGTVRHEVDRYVRWVSTIYPPTPQVDDGQLVAPMRPDRVGEEHVVQTLLDQPGLIATTGPTLTWEQGRRAFVVLGRALTYRPEIHGEVLDLLRSDPARLTVDATLQLVQFEDSALLADAVRRVLVDHPDPTAALQIVASLPTDVEALAPLHETAVTIALEHLTGDGAAELAATADLLMLRATRMLAGGRAGPAQAVALSVARIWKRLAEGEPTTTPTGPDRDVDPGHRRKYGRALGLWAQCLVATGRYDAARTVLAEAAALQREMIEQWPRTLSARWQSVWSAPVPAALVEIGVGLLRQDLATTLLSLGTMPGAMVVPPSDEPAEAGGPAGGHALVALPDEETFRLLDEATTLLAAAEAARATPPELPQHVIGAVDLMRASDGVLEAALPLGLGPRPPQ